MTKQLLSIFFLSCFSFFKNEQGFAQQNSCKGYYDKELALFVYTEVDQMPEYPGGITRFYKFISDVTLVGADQEQMQSTVFPTFVIDTSGHVKSIGIYQKLPKDYTRLDRNMIKLLKDCPQWEPAKCNNKKVAMRYRTRITLCYTN